ncbi:MAG TPA: lysylphosphatidylglycerol synthase transmembrane domain-containing protein [Blastocatellia bacterium]|nr:lysylphosphatidylglycerol synthase transmembrane domain-containing protein [Blastocatellia bacterium]
MKKAAITALKIAVSVGLYAYIFTKVDVGHLWETLKGANVAYFAAAVLVYLLIQTASAYRWHLLLRPLDIKATFPRLLSYYYLGMFFNNFLPTAIGGDLVKVYYLNKHTGSLSNSTASVFLDRDLGMAGLLLIAIVGSTLGGTAFNGVPLAPIFGLIAIAFICANLALFYRPTYNLLHRLLSAFRMKRVDERVEHLFTSFNSYPGEWRLLAGALALSTCIQLGCVIVNILAAEALGMQTRHGWLDFFVFIPAIGLISMVPVSVNGMGWRELSYIQLFVSAGAVESKAAALAFLWLGVLLASSLPGGIIYMVRLLRGEERAGTPDPDRLGAGHIAESPVLQGQPQEEKSVSPA